MIRPDWKSFCPDRNDIYYANYYGKGGDGQLGKKRIKLGVGKKNEKRGKKKGGKLHLKRP